MLKREKELKALLPLTVAVVMSVTAPACVSVVAVRPSVTMPGWPAMAIGAASSSQLEKALRKAQRRNTQRY